MHLELSFAFLLSYPANIRDWTQGVTHARQALIIELCPQLLFFEACFTELPSLVPNLPSSCFSLSSS